MSQDNMIMHTNCRYMCCGKKMLSKWIGKACIQPTFIYVFRWESESGIDHFL